MAKKQPHQLTIKIINKNGGGGGKSGSAPSTESGGKSVDTATEVIKGTVIAREIRSGVIQAFSHKNTVISLTTGNSISQERMSYAINLGGKLSSYGIAAITVSPAAAAAMVITDLVSTGVGTILKADTLNTAREVERESLALSRDRAGIAFNHSRMGGAK